MRRASKKALGAIALVVSCGGPAVSSGGPSAPTASSAGSEPPTAGVAPVLVTTHGLGASSEQPPEEDRPAPEPDEPSAPAPLPLGRPGVMMPGGQAFPGVTAPANDETVWKVPVLRDDPMRGPADALVTIVEFSDFECPFCKRVKPTLERILKAHPNDVRLVWKDNPLPFHHRAKPAAILARFAFEKGGSTLFWQVHDVLFDDQHRLEDADLRRIAEANGIAWNPIERAIKDGRAPKIDQNADLALDVNARGAPIFFINGKRLVGAQPIEKFEERIADALARAQALVARGVPRAKVYETILREAKPPESDKPKGIPPPDAATPIRGDRSAPVVLQVFMNFGDPHSKRLLPTLEALEREFSGQLQIAFRHMPLPSHQHSELAAEAAQEVFAQKGTAVFWQFHDQLFAVQEQGIGRDTLEAIAERTGVDMERFRKALDTGKHRSKVDADAALGKAAGITATPVSSINGRLLFGAQSAQAFRKLIKQALDDKKKP